MAPLFLIIAVGIGLTILVAAGDIILYLLPGSWIFALSAVVAVAAKAQRREGEPVRGGTRIWPRVLIAVILLSQILLSMGVLGAARRAALDEVSASNMRGIGLGLREYCTRFGTPPASFQDLLDADISTPGEFICPWSEDKESIDGTLVSSYEYFGGLGVCSGDPRRVVAAERGDWTAIRLRVIFARIGRRVLYADGHLESMEAGDLAVAIREP